MEKVNFLENTLLNVNQAYLTVKKTKNFFTVITMSWDKFSNPWTLLRIFPLTLWKRMKMLRHRYDSEAGELGGLYETVGIFVVRRSPEEEFFNNEFYKESQKFFIPITTRKFQTLSRGLFLTAIELWFKVEKLRARCQMFFFFLPSLTNTSEDINKYLNNVSISSINTTQQQFNAWAKTPFDLLKLDTYGLKKNTMNHAVIKYLKHVNDTSNSNIVCNADGLLSRKEVIDPVAWVGEHKQRLPPQKFKVSYWFLL